MANLMPNNSAGASPAQNSPLFFPERANKMRIWLLFCFLWACGLDVRKSRYSSPWRLFQSGFIAFFSFSSPFSVSRDVTIPLPLLRRRCSLRIRAMKILPSSFPFPSGAIASFGTIQRRAAKKTRSLRFRSRSRPFCGEDVLPPFFWYPGQKKKHLFLFSFAQ